MDEAAIARAKERIDQAAQGRIEPGDVDAALERARTQIEELAQLAAGLETTLPGRVEDAVREGVRSEAHPVGRQLAEVRGLANQTIRRLERLEGDLLAERHARVDDLALLVDLITSGWKGVDQRLARLERKIEQSLAGPTGGAVVYRLEERDLS
jgi:two-component sensor histidine kinase